MVIRGNWVSGESMVNQGRHAELVKSLVNMED